MDAILNCLIFLQAGTGVANAAAKAASTENPMNWTLLAVFIGTIVLPFVLGEAIARALKMKDLSSRISWVLLAFAVSLAPFVYHMALGRPWNQAVRLGIDLAGGTNLVFQVDMERAAEAKSGAADAPGGTGNSAARFELDPTTMDKLVGAVAKRINPSGAEEVAVRKVGRDRLEVIIPGVDREVVEQKKRLITRLGSLEFAILANQKDHPALIAKARALSEKQNDVREGGRVAASWRDVAPGKSISADGGSRTAERTVNRIVDGKSSSIQQLLVIIEPPDRAVTGKYLTAARSDQDENGQLCVAFTFGSQGANLFGNLTTRYAPDRTEQFQRRLAILLDGRLHSAPNLQEPITGGRGRITGQFSADEINELVGVLNAGALEVPLIPNPISEFTISPLLGKSVQTKGITAIVVSALAIIAFMLVYYGKAGLIANISLMFNLIMVVGAMAIINAAFTLPGLAGLVLTIGMAVDSNVLIYERMREEIARGSSIRMAIQNGFDKALSSIVDSNVTTLITAVILYMIGSDQIRGFAVSLFIGLTMSLFSVLYFGHLLFDMGERLRWIRDFKFMQFMKTLNVDYLGLQKMAFALSAVVILGGLAALWARGSDNFDIDFTGGTMVTFEFRKPQTTEDVRGRLAPQFKTMTLEQLTVVGQSQSSSEAATRYRMRTTERNRDVVQSGVVEAFRDGDFELFRVTVDVGELQAVAAKPAAGEGEKPESSPAVDERFAGGRRVDVSFSDPVRKSTPVEYLGEALREIGGGDGGKYAQPTALFEIAGVTNDGDEEAEGTGESAKFSKFKAQFTSDVAPEDAGKALETLKERFASQPVFDELNSFDSSVANETKRDAIWATILSLVVIVIYIWFRFEKVYFGYAAVAALAHDVLVTLGSVAVGAYLARTPIGPMLGLEEFQINMTLMASLLTIVGYSLNDTIVIFDRIREIKGKNPNITYDMINLSVNQTMSRTILTAATVFVVVVILYIFGGEGIHGFAYSLIIGSISGTYSTIYIANPVLLWLVNQAQKTSTTATTKRAVA